MLWALLKFAPGFAFAFLAWVCVLFCLRLRFVRAWVCVCVLFASAFRSRLGLRFVCVCVCVWVSRCVLRLRLLSYCDSCGGGRAFRARRLVWGWLNNWEVRVSSAAVGRDIGRPRPAENIEESDC